MTQVGGGRPSLRTVVFWGHLSAGVVAGLVVFIMSVTGVLLAYERQLLDRAARRYQAVPPSPAAQRLPLDTLLARVGPTLGDRAIVSVGLRADTAAPVALGFEDRRNIFVDPYTATVVGDDATLKSFFSGVQRWHRWLALGSSPRSPVGKAITGACNLAFLLLIVSGLYLWWPREWSARALRAVLFFRRDARGKARDWNWHHVLGFWSAPALLLIVASATFISYAWPGEVVQRILGETETERGGREERGERGQRAERRRPDASRGEAEPASRIVLGASLDAIRATAAGAVPGWRSMQFRLPNSPKQPVNVTVTTGAAARPDHRQQAMFDASTGALREWRTYGQGSTFRRFRSWIRPVHTGEAAGLAGQTVAAVVSAAASVLVWTGLALAWRRFRASIRRRQQGRAVARPVASLMRD